MEWSLSAADGSRSVASAAFSVLMLVLRNTGPASLDAFVERW
jgi:hypothetical protein